MPGTTQYKLKDLEKLSISNSLPDWTKVDGDTVDGLLQSGGRRRRRKSRKSSKSSKSSRRSRRRVSRARRSSSSKKTRKARKSRSGSGSGSRRRRSRRSRRSGSRRMSRGNPAFKENMLKAGKVREAILSTSGLPSSIKMGPVMMKMVWNLLKANDRDADKVVKKLNKDMIVKEFNKAADQVAAKRAAKKGN